MRLGEFILTNLEPILEEWERFARTIWSGDDPGSAVLRDHAEDVLRAAAADMRALQSGAEQAEKSRGRGCPSSGSAALDQASQVHALARVGSGFDLVRLVSEYRALRASVVRLWCECGTATGPEALEDLTRFHEAMDQSLARGIASFSRQLDYSRDVFLGILGHDLRSPLNAITLLSQVLAERSTGEAAEMAKQITASGEAAARILADFIDFTSARLGRGIPVTPEVVDFARVVREVVSEASVAGAGARLHLVVQGDMVGRWDGIRLRQLVGNLVGNAIQHGREEAPIWVELEGGEREVVMRVRNAGEPIPPDALGRLFEPLTSRSPEPGKTRRCGSIGLGLFIAREIIRAHGGSIGVRSDAADGTEFTVCLPRRHLFAPAFEPLSSVGSSPWAPN